MTRPVDVDPAPPLVISTEPASSSEWDSFVERSPGGTFCHLAAWRDIVGDVMGHESIHVSARDRDGTLRGVLPLVRVRSRLFGHFLVSMPFLNYGGPLGDRAARLQLAEWARDTAERERADLLELRWRPAAFEFPAQPDGGASGKEAPARGEGDDDFPAHDHEVPAGMALTHRKVTVLLPLPEDPQELWEKGLKSKLRSQVRRPMKEGFEARHGPTEIDPFYDVFAQNMRDLGTPVLTKRLFERLPRALGDRVHFTTVYDGETPIAGGCGFFFGEEFEITWASSLRAYNRQAPNMLLYWRMMEHAIERGARTFNFGRCTPGGGTHRFKLQWGGHDELLPWAAWSPGEGDSTPNPDQGKYKLATRIWSRLPVPLTRVVGPPLARRIP